jgi:hypothetical protein
MVVPDGLGPAECAVVAEKQGKGRPPIGNLRISRGLELLGCWESRSPHAGPQGRMHSNFVVLARAGSAKQRLVRPMPAGKEAAIAQFQIGDHE